MSQEYHNYVVIDGDVNSRREFILDAVRLSTAWGWDWVKIDLDYNGTERPKVHQCGDSGKSKLDFYSRNFPKGFSELMELHPGTTLTCNCVDLSAEVAHHLVIKDNEVFKDEEEVHVFED
jgi:hypothetical protein